MKELMAELRGECQWKLNSQGSSKSLYGYRCLHGRTLARLVQAAAQRTWLDGDQAGWIAQQRRSAWETVERSSTGYDE